MKAGVGEDLPGVLPRVPVLPSALPPGRGENAVINALYKSVLAATVLGLLPGLPTLPFLALAGLAGGAAWLRLNARKGGVVLWALLGNGLLYALYLVLTLGR